MRIAPFCLATMLCASMIASAFEGEDNLEYSDRYFLAKARFLCEWAKTNAADRPLNIRACDPAWRYNFAQTRDDIDAWWAQWNDEDGERRRAVVEQFERAYAVHVEIDRRAAVDAIRKKDIAHAKVVRDARIATIPKMSVAQLCAEFRRFKTGAAAEELVSRHAFNPGELSLIIARRVEIGMSEGAMLCVMGTPDSANRSAGSWGLHIQYVYAGHVYIYVENGTVSSWQD